LPLLFLVLTNSGHLPGSSADSGIATKIRRAIHLHVLIAMLRQPVEPSHTLILREIAVTGRPVITQYSGRTFFVTPARVAVAR
jgi:hypothetical protein